jgi:hypothetical protein
MIKGFDQETQPLNDYEMGVLLPLLVRGLRTKIGRENAVTNKHIVNTLKGSYKLNDARVRKIKPHKDKRPYTGLNSHFRRVFYRPKRSGTIGVRRKPKRA